MGFGAGDTNLYRYVNNSPTNFTDPTGEFANVVAGAGFGALFGGLYALANDIESGQFGWGTFGRVAQGAVVGAAIGAAASIGLAAATNVLAAGFQAVLGANTALGVATAGAIVNTTVAGAGAAVGAYNAGGNFGRGKYLTGALDLFGVAVGARNVFSGVTGGIKQAYYQDLASAIDNLVLPGNPAGFNSSGAIVPAGSSALANRTAVGGEIVPYSHPSAGQLVLANSAGRAISTSQAIITGGGDPAISQQYESFAVSNRMVSQEQGMSCGIACVRQFLRENGVKKSEAAIIKELNNLGLGKFDPELGSTETQLAGVLNKLHPSSEFVSGAVDVASFNALNKKGSWIAMITPPSDGTHFVIVDGVKNENVMIRDPWGLNAPSKGKGIEGELSISKFMAYWRLGHYKVVFSNKMKDSSK